MLNKSLDISHSQFLDGVLWNFSLTTLAIPTSKFPLSCIPENPQLFWDIEKGFNALVLFQLLKTNFKATDKIHKH